MSTLHIAADITEIAKTVLMPGDPLRSKFVAETFFTEPRLVNNIRGIQGYTGTYKGVPVTVMASGMGMPSMGIYSNELFTKFDVDNIIRIGTAGAISKDLKLRSIVAGLAACTNSSFITSQIPMKGQFAASASYKLLRAAEEAARARGVELVVGNLYSSDNFYYDPYTLTWGEYGCLAVEMEAAALYFNALKHGKHALAICTISDHVLTGEETTAEERQSTFTEMMEIALDTAVSPALRSIK